MIADCCKDAIVWKLILAGLPLNWSYLLWERWCIEATCCGTAAVLKLLVVGWLLVAAGILLARWLLVADGMLLVAAGVLVDRWILVVARVLVVEFGLSLSKIETWKNFGQVTSREERSSEYEQPSARPESGSDWCWLLCRSGPEWSYIDIARDHHIANKNAWRSYVIKPRDQSCHLSPDRASMVHVWIRKLSQSRWITLQQFVFFLLFLPLGNSNSLNFPLHRILATPKLPGYSKTSAVLLLNSHFLFNSLLHISEKCICLSVSHNATRVIFSAFWHNFLGWAVNTAFLVSIGNI